MQTVHIVVNKLRDSIFCLLCYVFVFKFSAIYIYDSVLTSYFITPFDIVLFTRSNYDRTRQKCNVISLNVRGLRNRVKRRSIFCFLKDQNCDVFFLRDVL